MVIKAIVAVDSTWGISKNGTIPWVNKEDMQFFKEKTIGNGNNAVVMGRVTQESLPLFPLPGRKNFVVSLKNQGDFSSLEQIKTLTDFSEVWIIGGAQIYEAMLATKLAQHVYISHIKGLYHCDLFFNRDLLIHAYAKDTTRLLPNGVQIEVWSLCSF